MNSKLTNLLLLILRITLIKQIIKSRVQKNNNVWIQRINFFTQKTLLINCKSCFQVSVKEHIYTNSKQGKLQSKLIIK